LICVRCCVKENVTAGAYAVCWWAVGVYPGRVQSNCSKGQGSAAATVSEASDGSLASV
ncbi:hypothetical protein BgiBS90_021264, partial [Biomphalaria glabrata]